MNKFVLPEIYENGVFLKNVISFIFNDINANFSRGTRHNSQKNGVMASFKLLKLAITPKKMELWRVSSMLELAITAKKMELWRVPSMLKLAITILFYTFVASFKMYLI